MRRRTRGALNVAADRGEAKVVDNTEAHNGVEQAVVESEAGSRRPVPPDENRVEVARWDHSTQEAAVRAAVNRRPAPRDVPVRARVVLVDQPAALELAQARAPVAPVARRLALGGARVPAPVVLGGPQVELASVRVSAPVVLGGPRVALAFAPGPARVVSVVRQVELELCRALELGVLEFPAPVSIGPTRRATSRRQRWRIRRLPSAPPPRTIGPTTRLRMSDTPAPGHQPI